MKLKFNKYHGAGNDFILINAIETPVDLSSQEIAFLCHRHFGIGADGLMLLLPSENSDFRMRYFNADGKEGTMCGNGGRCIVAFAKQEGVIKHNHTVFEAIDGMHEAIIISENTIRLKMSDVAHITTIDHHFYFLDTGSPHAVLFTDNIDEIDVETTGKQIRYSPQFKDGTNVNFVEYKNHKWYMRTYERGVEAETLACGTGTVAVALSIHSQNLDTAPITLYAKGGTLTVDFEKKQNKYTDIWLEGPVKHVFSGNINL